MEPHHPSFMDVWSWNKGMERLLEENIWVRFGTDLLPRFARMFLFQQDERSV